MLSNHLIPCHPFSFCLQYFPASRSFPMSLLFAPKYWTLASVIPMNILGWYPLILTGLVPLQSNSLLQHHNSEASILQCSAFFMVQLIHPYMTTGKTIALTIQTFVGKVMSMPFNVLSRFVIALLPRSMFLLISWLQSPSAVILEPKKIKFLTVSHCFPICLPWSDGTGYHDLSFLNVEF